MDNFCEHMIKKERSLKDNLVVAGLILGGILATALLFFITLIFAHPITFVVLDMVLWYFIYVFITRRNVEYELSFTNGDLDIDAIYSKKRRVHMLSTRVRDFEICAPTDDERFYKKFTETTHIKRIYSAQSFSKNATVYFADFYLNAEKVRLVFEPTEKMIKKMKLYNDKNICIKGE